MDETKEQSFFSRNWSITLIVAGVIALIILFIVFGGTSTVSPDLRYFPT